MKKRLLLNTARILFLSSEKKISRLLLSNILFVAVLMIGLFFSPDAKAQFTATWALTSNSSVSVSGAQSSNITVGSMSPGTNFSPNGSFSANGYLCKQTLGNWPTIPDDNDVLDFPISPNGSVNLTVTGITLTAKTANSSGANLLSLAYQVDGAGAWTTFGTAQSAASGGTTSVDFGTLSTVLAVGHTYTIRLYIYAAGSTTNSGRTVSIKNMAIAGTSSTVLPITIQYFGGQKTINGNAINWKLYCASAKVSMEVQRSADAKNYTAITTVSADQLRCNQPFNYMDATPAAINYYRLKLTDINGHVSYSSTIAIINSNKGIAIVGLYPSVASSHLFLNVTSAKNTSIKTVITDMNGKTIRSATEAINTGNNLIKIDCSGLPGGVYNITGFSNEAPSTTMRFIKL